MLRMKECHFCLFKYLRFLLYFNLTFRHYQSPGHQLPGKAAGADVTPQTPTQRSRSKGSAPLDKRHQPPSPEVAQGPAQGHTHLRVPTAADQASTNTQASASPKKHSCHSLANYLPALWGVQHRSRQEEGSSERQGSLRKMVSMDRPGSLVLMMMRSYIARMHGPEPEPGTQTPPGSDDARNLKDPPPYMWREDCRVNEANTQRTQPARLSR